MNRSSFLPSWILTMTVVLSFHFMVGCASEDKKSNTPEGLFAIAKEYEDDERFEEAIRKYNEVKNKFPYSAVATQAELAVADVYFKQESYPEAQIAYVSFRELHPKHPQIDYVIFRTALSYFKQLPETIDRDLSLANEAINHFNEVITLHPSSPHVAESKEKKSVCIKKLAEKEDYIGEFYFKRDLCESAIQRYENLLKKYSAEGFEAKSYSRIAICAKKTGDEVKAQKYYSLLKEKFMDSDEFKDARKVLN